jgi:RNA polymerase sigma factor (sigma-70 family)
VFPTTVWDLVRDAGANDPDALQRFARDYRQPVLQYLRARGARREDAEDLCQEVFVRLLQSGILARADREKGTFRGLVKTITMRIHIDWLRRRKPATVEAVDPAAPEPDFDQAWALHLTERALARLAEQSPGYHEALQQHLDGKKVHRNRLWIARNKLRALLRREVALTCRDPEEMEAEYRRLAPWLEKK